MTTPAKWDAGLALFEAEMLYYCADLGGDVLDRAIRAVATMHADRNAGDAQPAASSMPATMRRLSEKMDIIN